MILLTPNVVGALERLSKRMKKRNWGTGNQRKNRDHLDYSTMKIRLNTLYSHGDQRRFYATQISEKSYPFYLLWLVCIFFVLRNQIVCITQNVLKLSKQLNIKSILYRPKFQWSQYSTWFLGSKPSHRRCRCDLNARLWSACRFARENIVVR